MSLSYRYLPLFYLPAYTFSRFTYFSLALFSKLLYPCQNIFVHQPTAFAALPSTLPSSIPLSHPCLSPSSLHHYLVPICSPLSFSATSLLTPPCPTTPTEPPHPCPFPLSRPTSSWLIHPASLVLQTHIRCYLHYNFL